MIGGTRMALGARSTDAHGSGGTAGRGRIWTPALCRRRPDPMRFQTAVRARLRRGQGVTILVLNVAGLSVFAADGAAAVDVRITGLWDRLAAALRPDDRIVRIAERDFGVLFATGTRPRTAAQMARGLIGAAGPAGAAMTVGIASAGTSTAHADWRAGRLIADAGLAMRAADPNQQIADFAEAMRDTAGDRGRLADDMLSGLPRGEFVAVYQPIFGPDGRTPVQAEALMRWRHPVHGLLHPARFLPVAADLGLSERLDQAMLSRVGTDLARLDRAGVRVPRVSVNVTAARILSPDFARRIREAGVPPDRLVLEVLESSAHDAPDPMEQWALDQLRETGAGIELDDFGTGHASVASAMVLRPDRLKVAREIVTAPLGDDARRRLLAAVAAVGDILGVGLTAEGVGSTHEVAGLRALGFDRFQGFGLAEPMTLDALGRVFAPPARTPSDSDRTGAGTG